MDETAELSELLNGLRAGDRDACSQLYERFGPTIQAAVRRRLNSRLRARFDSIDFVHDVWASFLAMPPERHSFGDPQELIGYLSRVARNKVIDEYRRRFSSQKDNARIELRLDHDNEKIERPMPTSTPTPSQWVIADEELHQLLSRLPLGHRAIVLRLREGYSIEDIARLANVSRSTVDRVVKRLREISKL